MHTSFQELLSVRDGAPVDARVPGHLESCARCRAELAHLAALQEALKRLPSFEPPRDAYGRMRPRLRGKSALPSPRRWPALAAASSVALLLMSAFLWITQANRGALQALKPRGLDALVARSQKLEALLQSLPPRPDVEQAATSATIDALQSRIELLDLQLSRGASVEIKAEEVQRLWNDRVQLLNSLVYVRYAEAAGDGHGAARPLELGVI